MAVKTAQSRTRSGAVVVNIRDARKNLPEIVNAVAEGASRGVVIGRRGKPAAAIVSYDLLSLLRSSDKKRKLATLIVEELLADAPPHLKGPAVNELSRLPNGDLDKLWRIEVLPAGERQRRAFRARLSHPEVFDRLVRRFEVANAIKQAHLAGLYDRDEDVTSRMVDEGTAAE
jgi:prevent-host-death family protein